MEHEMGLQRTVVAHQRGERAEILARARAFRRDPICSSSGTVRSCGAITITSAPCATSARINPCRYV